MSTNDFRKQEFQRIFQQRFNELLEQGIARSEAASQAIIYANNALTENSQVDKVKEIHEKLDIDCDLRMVPEDIKTIPTIIQSHELKTMILNYQTSGNDRDLLLKTIHMFFSESTSISYNFSLSSMKSNDMTSMDVDDYRSHDDPTATMKHGFLSIDIEEVYRIFELLLSFTDHMIHQSLQDAMEKLVFNLSLQILEITSESLVTVLKPFLVALIYPELNEPSNFSLLSMLLLDIEKLPIEAKAQLCYWIGHHIGSSSRYLQLISVIRQFITVKVYEEAFDEARTAVRMMSILYQALSSYPDISYKEFYNDALNHDYFDSREGKVKEFQLWIKDQYQKKSTRRSSSSRPVVAPIISTSSTASTSISHVPVQTSSSDNNNNNVMVSDLMMIDGMEDSSIDTPSLSPSPPTIDAFVILEPIIHDIKRYTRGSSFISYPFVLSPSTKASILEIDTAFQMQREMEHEVHAAMISGQRYVMPYLVLRVSRQSIVADTIIQMSLYSSTSDFKKPLKVIFDNEEGVDAGGVRKEFFQVINRQLLDPTYGMFKYHDDSRLIWFNSDSYESSQEFELIGTLLGVAIYNSIIIDLRMPRAVYKKLKGETCGLHDLIELEPVLGHGLQSLLDHDVNDDIASIYQFVFQLTYEVFGEIHVVDLIPNGGDIRVDASNRQQYVDLYVKYIMEDSIHTQFEAFAKGFKKVCGGVALDLFEPPELELLICGNPTLDISALEEGTKYEDGYNAMSQPVRWFWTAIRAFDEEEKKLFLQFISGSNRSPIDGLSKLGFTVSKNGIDDSRLPSAHTCFNHLLLPAYSTEDIMKEKLKYAIAHAEGFGLR